MTSPKQSSPIDRRQFVRAASAFAALGVAPVSSGLFAGPSPASAAETVVGELYKTLTEQQKKEVCLPFHHQLRSRINANWHITNHEIGDGFFTDKQKVLIQQILKNITTKDGYEILEKQMEEDSGGLDQYAIAIFGEPGNGKFEFELTGRHLTLRADGDSVDQAAFGGPIVYGHSEENPAKNLFHYQTEQTNEVFKALSADQAKKALVEKAPKEAAVQIQGASGKFPGIGGSELTSDQKQLVEKTLSVLLAPFRSEDVSEVMEIVNASGGVDQLHMAFYQQGDLKSDKKWDIWRIEGPSFVWHFRGAPHVHAYINIGQKKA